jgi:hypothetical protein
MTLRRPIRTAGCLILFVLAAAAFSNAAIRLKVTAELANIRQKPSISSTIIRQIPEGAIIEAASKSGEWYLVSLEPDDAGTTSGYVHESLVLPLDAAAVPEKKERIIERVAPQKTKPAETIETNRREPPAKKPVEEPPAGEPETVKTTNAPPLRPALVLGGTGLFAKVGDLNHGAQGLADLYAFQLNAAGDREVPPLHWTLPVGAELIIPLSARLALSAGMEYYGASRQSIVAYGQKDKFTVAPEFRVIPVKIGLVYYPASFLYCRLGAMLAFAKASYSYRFEHDEFWQEWSGQATALGLGIFGGVGVELPLGSSLAFLLEVSGQYAAIKGFEGTGTLRDSTLAEPVVEAGQLYAYDGKPTALNVFPLVYIRSKMPTEGGVANARQAELDLLGMALRAGIKIKF